MRKLALALLLLVFTTSCSHIRMGYDAQVKRESGAVSAYHFEKTYDTGSMPTFCGVTAIFLGGACWFYLVMPTTPQEADVTADAKSRLEQLLSPASYEILRPRTDRVSWEEQPEAFELEGHQKD